MKVKMKQNKLDTMIEVKSHLFTSFEFVGSGEGASILLDDLS
jgi:hypothetical protein